MVELNIHSDNYKDALFHSMLSLAMQHNALLCYGFLKQTLVSRSSSLRLKSGFLG